MKFNWNLCFPIAAFLILLKLSWLFPTDYYWVCVATITALSYPVKIKKNIYSLWGGFNSEGSVYSLFGIIQDAREHACSLLGISIAQLADDGECWHGIGIAIFQLANEDAQQLIGATLLQISREECRQWLGFAAIQRGDGDVEQFIGIALWQQSEQTAVQLVGIVLIQIGIEYSRQGIGIALYKTASKCFCGIGITLLEKASFFEGAGVFLFRKKFAPQ